MGWRSQTRRQIAQLEHILELSCTAKVAVVRGNIDDVLKYINTISLGGVA